MKRNSFWLVVSVLVLVSLACAPSVLFEATPEPLDARQPTAAEPPATAMPTLAPEPTVAVEPTLATESPQPDAFAIDLTNTSWAGSYEGDPDQFFNPTFLPGGVMRYSVPSGTWENGTWIQQGKLVIIETNNHYADMTGVISGSEIDGTAHNTAGKNWKWHVTLVSSSSQGSGPLANTRWEGTDSDGDTVKWYLMPNGIVEYANPDTYYRNGTWTLDGDQFHFETNNHYADYTGTLDGSNLSGSTKNVKNSTWTWNLTKVETCTSFCGQLWVDLYNTAWQTQGAADLWIHFQGSELAYKTSPDGLEQKGSYTQNGATLSLDLSPTYKNCSAEMRGDLIFLACGSSSWTLEQVKAW